MSLNNIYLIDSSIYIFRAWYMLPENIVDAKGNAANAVYGFADFLIQIIEQEKPYRLACIFDENHAKSRRKEIFPNYKANRSPTPENLIHQFSRCRELCQAFGIHTYASKVHEADDIIGNFAKQAQSIKQQSIIISADKDLAQFIDKEDTWWDFARKRRSGYKDIIKRFKVKPQQIPDLLALAGDKVDNIPGVPGIGFSIAARLLIKWGTLDNLFEHLPQAGEMKFRGAKRISELLAMHESTVRLSRRLTGLFNVKNLPTEPHHSQIYTPNVQQQQQLFSDFDFSESRCNRYQKALALRSKQCLVADQTHTTHLN